MAGPPIKKRTAVSYARDAEAINRLRTAIYLDSKLPKELQQEALDTLDKAVQIVIKIRDTSIE